MGNEENMASGLDAFLASKNMHVVTDQADDQDAGGDQTDDGDQELSGSSEQDDLTSDGGNQDRDAESDSDDVDDDEERQQAQNDSRSKLIRNISKLERRTTEYRQQLKEREEQLRQAQEQLAALAGADDDDDLDLLRRRAARKLGVREDDPAVMEYLFDKARDITSLHIGDADPDLKKRKEELLAERKRRDAQIQAERRIKELEEKDRQREVQAQRREAVADIQQMLSTKPHPFLSAAVDDPASVIMEIALEAVTAGRVQAPKTAEDGAKLIGQIAANLEAHHRKRAQKLAALLGESADNRLDNNVNTPDRNSAAKKTQTGATKRRAPAVGSNGGGGRGRPSPDRDPEMADEGPEDLGSFMNRRKREAASYRRGSR